MVKAAKRPTVTVAVEFGDHQPVFSAELAVAMAMVTNQKVTRSQFNQLCLYCSDCIEHRNTTRRFQR